MKRDSDTEDIATALDNAADYIEVHGWCQNNLSSPDGGVCLYGSLLRANRVADKSHIPTVRAAMMVVDRRLEVRGEHNAIRWNERRGTHRVRGHRRTPSRSQRPPQRGGVMGVLSPAGAAREHATTCAKCGDKTWAHDRICGFCRPDAHEAAEARDEMLSERYS